jgi:hypothetical protein
MSVRLVSGRCQCTNCGELFSSVREFDRHRTGSFAPAGSTAHRRRCLTVDELTARGWTQDERGYRRQGRKRAPAAKEDVCGGAATGALP